MPGMSMVQALNSAMDVMLARNPGYYEVMWQDSLGRVLLVLAFLLQAAGVVVIWRMMRSVEAARTIARPPR